MVDSGAKVRDARANARVDAGLDAGLDADAAAAMWRDLPAIAEITIAAVTADVPSYAQAFNAAMGVNIERAVELALGTFLKIAEQSADPAADPGPLLGAARDAAYALGRGEARSGRSMDALLSAYRIGVRAAWRRLSGIAVDAELSAAAVARFAELLFAYIDELSSVSAAGHSDELATIGRTRQRLLDQLAQQLLSGASEEHLRADAERAEWTPPRSLTAVLLPTVQAQAVLPRLDPATLVLSDDQSEGAANTSVLLVPDAHERARPALLTLLAGTRAVVGPARDWIATRTSYERARRAAELPRSSAAHGGLSSDVVLDTEEHLAELVVSADAEALRDLRHRVLAPLADLRPAAANRLVETLRAWLLHQGRRENIAADLFVHPQTVRYRMGQLRELYGERLDDSRFILELTVALTVEHPVPASAGDVRSPERPIEADRV